MRRILFIPLLTLILTAGCKVGPDFRSPEPQTNESYRFTESEDSLYNLVWWEMFQDETLEQLVHTALKENRDLKRAAARIEEARAIVGFTQADVYPAFGYSASYNGGNIFRALTGNESPSGESQQNFMNLSLPTLSWEIDFWGKFRRATEAARAELLSSEFARRKVTVSLISEVISTYFQLLDYDNKLKISKNTLESRRSAREIVEEKFNEGYVPEIDLNQAQIQEGIAASAVPIYERSVAKTENALSVLIGRNPGAILRGDSLTYQVIPPEVPAGLPSQLLQRRPDILESEYALAAQTARVGVAEAARFPAFSLTAALGSITSDLTSIASGESLFWTAGASLAGPLFNFGKNKRRAEIERKRTQQAMYAYEQTVLQAFREVEDALIDVQTYADELVAQDYRLKAARHANMLSKERYNGGVTSFLEVLNSETYLFEAELARSSTLKERLNSYVLLYKALGGGWISQEEMQQAEEAVTEPQQ